jgi:cytochrome c-type biogenesis protein CcmE
VTFTLAFNDVELPVRHTGNPRELFGAGRSVVLEGHFAEGTDAFVSDYMLVKHDEDYTDDNADRVADAEDGHAGD